MFKIILGGLALAVSMSVPAASADAPTTHHKPAQHERVDLPYWTTKPCPTTLSVNCRWTPPKGYEGPSEWMHVSVRYWVPGPKGERITCVFFAERKFAKNHDYCA